MCLKNRFWSIILFSLTLVFTTLWMQITLILGSLGQSKNPLFSVNNNSLQTLIANKTGVWIDSFKLAESDHPYGMMVGIPSKPQLILSKGLYNSFNSDELQYVTLHEAGHYVLNHTLKELIFGTILFFVGAFILRRIAKTRWSFMLALLIGVLFGILAIQQGRYHELQADDYALSKMDNPMGMITATTKFEQYFEQTHDRPKQALIQQLFYRGNPYENRIKMAEEKLKII